MIDKRFISERVAQLRSWNMEFIHADIRNRELVKETLNEADVVHHLAGITDVARTKDEQDENKDKEMHDVSEKGTSIVLSETSKNCKIIFPSTHVVFEGKDLLTKNIKEDYEKFPLLTYAIGQQLCSLSLFG